MVVVVMVVMEKKGTRKVRRVVYGSFFLLCKLVAEINEVFPSSREVLSDERYGGTQVSSDL